MAGNGTGRTGTALARLPNNAPHPDAEYARSLPARTAFPLADFAVRDGADVRLPEVVEDIATVIGRHAAIRMVEAARQTGARPRRRQVYIPKRVHEAHPLAAMIGLKAARALSVTHAHMVVELPQCRELVQAYEAWLAARWHAEGWTVPEIAVELCRSERAVAAMIPPEASR